MVHVPIVAPRKPELSLRRWSSLINAVAVVWIAIITVVFMLPPNELVLWTMLAVAVGLAAVWALLARRHFQGPANVAH